MEGDGMNEGYSTVPASELDQLFALTHPDPHSVLGIHPLNSGFVVRAFRPEAESIELLFEAGAPRTMSRVHPYGFFELIVEDSLELFPYRLLVHYPNGNSFELRDPYTFLPTLVSFDEHLFGEGRHERLYEKLGSHVLHLGGVDGVSFAVWAPSADGVSVVGDFNNWDGRLHQMRRLGVSGIWELFIPDLPQGARYKYEIHCKGSAPFLKADPYAFETEIPPATSSIVFQSTYQFNDQDWMANRRNRDLLRQPLSIYEVHLGSWRRLVQEENRPLTYRETAPALAEYVLEMGFTHVEFLPLKGYPYGGSWGYQVSAYYAPTSRFGGPDDFRFLVDYLHQRGIGVIMDWVPAHFPKDAFALGRFDGSALYEHLDERQGEHPDWGTYIFNYGRNEVRNFLIANALFWIDEYHIDGLRVDAVASMLYLDYSRTDGRWIPNQYGGRENLEALAFVKELNQTVHFHNPDVMMIAEESTSWPNVSRPIPEGGLGFDFKWNMGWMHDTLLYFSKDALYRKYHHNNLTFGLFYAWTENFILPFSHDEVVHLKGSLLDKMAGDRWQKFANLRALYGYMWAHPGKKLLFMGDEFGQWREWNFEQSLDWHLLEEADHRGLNDLVRALNFIYKSESALWEADIEPAGFQWIDADNADENMLSFIRKSPATGRGIICVCNFSPVTRFAYRLGVPRAGEYRQRMNTDASQYGGNGTGYVPGIVASPVPWQGLQHSMVFDLPALATVWFELPFEST
jgi:1,4-alpha-glucan branching enzyme